MRQYKFNIDVGPDRLSLQAMEKEVLCLLM